MAKLRPLADIWRVVISVMGANMAARRALGKAMRDPSH